MQPTQLERRFHAVVPIRDSLRGLGSGLGWGEAWMGPGGVYQSLSALAHGTLNQPRQTAESLMDQNVNWLALSTGYLKLKLQIKNTLAARVTTRLLDYMITIHHRKCQLYIMPTSAAPKSLQWSRSSPIHLQYGSRQGGLQGRGCP